MPAPWYPSHALAHCRRPTGTKAERMSDTETVTDLETVAARLDAHDDFRVIRRYRRPERYAASPTDDTVVRKGLYLDTETTGLDPDTDRIIELAMVPFEFSSDGRIYTLGDELDQLEDPGRPIPPEIVKLTGISDDMVAGKTIDDDAVVAMLADAAIVVAHNAGFDRPFCEARWSAFESKAWGCSQRQVPWAEAGFESSKLEYLAYRSGFFYDGHRATIDCLAGIDLLARDLPGTGGTALKALLDTARGREWRIWAVGSPFEAKDVLKARGYRWNGGEDGRHKAWYVDVPDEQKDEELRYLSESIFRRRVDLPCDLVNAFNRFSSRI